MKALKWIGMFFLLWLIGSVIYGVVDFGLAFVGISLGSAFGGVIILATIVIGLILYGRKKTNEPREI